MTRDPVLAVLATVGYLLGLAVAALAVSQLAASAPVPAGVVLTVARWVAVPAGAGASLWCWAILREAAP